MPLLGELDYQTCIQYSRKPAGRRSGDYSSHEHGNNLAY